jgi:site-specific recombinase XerD
MAANTLAAYRSDWARFERWCQVRGLVALPAQPATLAEYLAEAATQPAVSAGRQWRYSPATLARWVAGIDKAHEVAGLAGPGTHPEVRAVLSGIRRARATPPERRAPLLLDDLERVVAGVPAAGWPAAVAGWRDRALLVMGWVGAFRRSELVGLVAEDVRPHAEDGLHVLLRRSKTDQEAEGAIRALPYARRRPLLCAPCAWTAWAGLVSAWEGHDGGPGGRAGTIRALRAITACHGHLCAETGLVGNATTLAASAPSTPLFRAVHPDGTIGRGSLTGHAVNSVVKRRAASTGYPVARLGGHSLRAGFVTQAFRTGASAHSIMRQTGHRDPAVLEIYAREGAPLVGNAVTELGL